MEEESKPKPTDLPSLLQEIIKGNKTIISELEKFSNDTEELQKKLHSKEEENGRESATMQKIGEAINRDLAKTYHDNRKQLQEILQETKEKAGKITVSLKEQDQQKINKLERLIKQFWKLPAIISLASVLIAGITSYLAFNFYSKSVKSKQEMLSEYAENGYILAKKKDVDNLIYNNDLLDQWIKENPNDSKHFKLWVNRKYRKEQNK